MGSEEFPDENEVCLAMWCPYYSRLFENDWILMYYWENNLSI